MENFSQAELSRLAVYKAAKDAGFYNDDQHLDNSYGLVQPSMVALPSIRDSQTGEMIYSRFTQEQFNRLKGMRAAITSGSYADDYISLNTR